MGINMQRNKQTWNITDLINYSSITNAQDFGSALQQIDNKLHDIKKEITYWDVYNISTAVYNQEEFESRLANLNINSSLVINTTSFSTMFNGRKTDFHSGDIIIRLKDGSYNHIKAANAGVYIPTLTTNDNKSQLTITYEYAPTVSEENKQRDVEIQTLTGTDSGMYGYDIIVDDNNPCTKEQPFSIPYIWVDMETVKITPVIKFFDANRQEVYTDEYTLSEEATYEFTFYLHNNSSKIIRHVVIK